MNIKDMSDEEIEEYTKHLTKKAKKVIYKAILDDKQIDNPRGKVVKGENKFQFY